MKPSELLARGWCQREFHRKRWPFALRSDKYCLVGAIEAVYTFRDRLKYIATAEQILIEKGFNSGLLVWNDTTGRTQEEVVELAKEAERRFELIVS